MPDTSKCFPLVRGRVMRATQLDGCGAKVLGPTSSVVSDGFVTVTLTPQSDAGTTIAVTNANGDLCINDVPCPRFTGYDVSVAFCNVNPDLFAMMTGQPIVTDSQATPQGVGFRINSATNACNVGFALEVWSAVPTAACAVGAGVSYGYFLVPFIKGGIVDAITIGNDAISFTISGAASKDGSAWGVGPYNVTSNVSGVATPLKTAIDSRDHLHLELVTVAPPTALCGASALGVPATSAVAGTPSTLLPANSYAPASFATIGALTASPGTNWTTGQYLVLRDGTYANWNGTAWVVGIHA